VHLRWQRRKLALALWVPTALVRVLVRVLVLAALE
jgi:cytochrome c oxidase subunit IV